MKTPVALLIFNRPVYTQRVFDQIRQYRPSRLLVVADGPRSAQEAQLCAATRAVIKQVDWDCEVHTSYSDVNLGCKRRVSSGLTWVFDQCEEAIILEDDCLPHPSFFDYCNELLERYRHDERIATINGSNFQFGRERTSYSYYFSRYTHVWGWASWRRTWQDYDVSMRLWPELRETSFLHDILGRQDAVSHWRRIFDSVFNGHIDTWDYQWTFTNWAQSRLAIAPRVNLISNIGFGIDATHTKEAVHPCANLPSRDIDLPLHHPRYLVRCKDADEFEFERDAPGMRERLRQLAYDAVPETARQPLRRVRSYWQSI